MLILVALCATLAVNLHISIDVRERLWQLWPFVLVAAGVLLVLQALSGRRAR